MNHRQGNKAISQAIRFCTEGLTFPQVGRRAAMADLVALYPKWVVAKAVMPTATSRARCEASILASKIEVLGEEETEWSIENARRSAHLAKQSRHIKDVSYFLESTCCGLMTNHYRMLKLCQVWFSFACQRYRGIAVPATIDCQSASTSDSDCGGFALEPDEFLAVI